MCFYLSTVGIEMTMRMGVVTGMLVIPQHMLFVVAVRMATATLVRMLASRVRTAVVLVIQRTTLLIPIGIRRRGVLRGGTGRWKLASSQLFFFLLLLLLLQYLPRRLILIRILLASWSFIRHSHKL